MATAVACPSCGADGTNAANAVIAQSLASSSDVVLIPPAKKQLRVTLQQPPNTQSVVTPRNVQHDSRLGLVSREQAETEARAKVSWGDSAEDVIKYLMIQGFSHEEASDFVRELFKIRMAETRGNGIRNIVVGSGMICVPIVTYIIFAIIGYISFKIMGLAGAVGLWGCWKLVNGCIQLLAPKMETGDVAEQ